MRGGVAELSYAALGGWRYVLTMHDRDLRVH